MGYIVHQRKVKKEFVQVEGCKDTYIQWLIDEKVGAKNFAMRRFTVMPGGYTPLHRHPEEHEIYILRGKALVRLGGKEYEVQAGHAIFVPSNELHQIKNAGDTPLIFLCMIGYKRG